MVLDEGPKEQPHPGPLDQGQLARVGGPGRRVPAAAGRKAGQLAEEAGDDAEVVSVADLFFEGERGESSGKQVHFFLRSSRPTM